MASTSKLMTLVMPLLGLSAIGSLAYSEATEPFSEHQISAVEVQLSVPTEGHYMLGSDIKTYYEIRGQGEPVLFIHAGFNTSEMWLSYAERMSSDYMVITPDSRGHGRTTDGAGPITYGRMANDMVRLLDYLNIEKAHIVGHSDGGVIALHLLVDFPDRVKSAVLIGTPYNITNYKPGGIETLQEIMSKLYAGEDLLGFKSGFDRLSPDPSRYKEIISKLTTTYLSQPFFNRETLESITPPVLVIKVDNDEYLAPEVFDDLASSIPNARIFHIPEGKHNVPRVYTDELTKAIREFIDSQVNTSQQYDE